MKKNVPFLALVAFMASWTNSVAQTSPGAVSLPFSLSSQSTSTLPSGVAVHRFNSIPTTRTLLPANGDLPSQGSSVAGTAGGWYNLGNDGIGLLSSASNPAGAIVVAITTNGLSNISVSWLCKTIKNQASRDNSIALQYRLGTSGNFIDVGTGSTYSSTGQADGTSSAVFTETLPAAANNQAVVQVRWIYWESSSVTGSRDKIAVDNISITGAVAGCGTPGGLSASGISTSSVSLSWNAVSGASSYEYAVSTSSTPPVAGTSNSSTSITVSGLTSGTPYYLHVRSVCSGSLFSSWASSSFNTTSDPNAEFLLMSYNLLNYPGSTAGTREPSYRIIVDSIQPDIVVVQEISNSSGIGSFLSNVLNYSTSSYSAGTFIDGPDSDNGIFYKSTKFQFISNTPIATDLRDINQFMLKYIPSGDTLIIYSAHLKASDTPADAAQRATEVDNLRAVTNAFPAGKQFVVCGDFNIYGDYESAYQKLIVTGSNVNGKFNDLLSLSGTWNNSAYAIHHTQSPRTTSFGGGATGGMDDRFDMILFSNAIVNAGGLDIVTNSYKAFGNDGNHFNQALNTPPYTLYSSTVCGAIHDASDHLPVIVKLKASSSSLKLSNALSEGGSMETVSVYPNPAHNVIHLRVNASMGTALHFDLYDISGRLVQNAVLEGTTGETTSMDLSGLKPGLYYLRSEQSNSTYKIIIE